MNVIHISALEMLINTVFPITMTPNTTQFVTLIVNVGRPADFLKWSNLTTLKFGLYIISHAPRNSIVALLRIQFFIMSTARLSSSEAFTISVKQIKSSLLIPVTTKISVEREDTWCEDGEEHTGLVTLKELWEQFSEIPVNNDDKIERDFLLFPAGTSKLDVWHWFDERCPNNQ